jgi:two-component system OmpR family response regulator
MPRSVLALSPFPQDHAFLRDVLDPLEWRFFEAGSLSGAMLLLRENPISVVLSEDKLTDSTWKNVLSVLQSMPSPPHLIVTSGLADERLWAEVLNLCGYDVIAKPFHPSEVLRTLTLAVRNVAPRELSAHAG